MVRDGLLTKFQAEQILQGKFRRFLLGDKYRLLEPIGAGGMGQVFLCFHIYMHRLVALNSCRSTKSKIARCWSGFIGKLVPPRPWITRTSFALRH